MPPPQHQSMNIYPSISSNLPSGHGTAESFYTNPQEPYGRPQSTYNYPPPQQYPAFDKRASMPGPSYPGLDQRQDPYNQTPVQPQRTGSYQAPAPHQYPQQVQGYPPENTQVTPGLVPSQPPSNYVPSEPLASPPVDPNAGFYYGTAPPPSQATAPAPQPEQAQPQFAPMQSPSQSHHVLPVHQSPQLFTRQPSFSQQQPAPQIVPQPQQAPQPQPPQQPYWQSQQPNQVPAPQQSWQTPQAYNGYTQDSFPAAPNHAPQPKPVAVEESLIEF
jgi:growth factor-regulated tyrosine kinase substrate